ncbi:hypothetical protein F442_05109 [Phytophthora nicotianae P10297]|uniref:Phosphoglycerate mutase n=1 Tax=Phytophthora nicotianae P10297 TaxID=1317064 RepID=W2ZQT6_PHYNI|nr:hypothetical protein F442_05109 [Phytophthora nicotianae P10297]
MTVQVGPQIRSIDSPPSRNRFASCHSSQSLTMVLALRRSLAMSSRVANRSLGMLHQQQKAMKHTHTLVLIRHGESEWNKKNLFTGWYDVQLSEKGNKEAAAAGQLLKKEGYTFDIAYTSYLKRAIRTLWHVLEQTDQMWIPVFKTWRLNERHYGALTGLDKQATVEKHGAEKVLEWRRSYNIPPPDLDTSSEYYPGNDIRYKDVLRRICLWPSLWNSRPPAYCPSGRAPLCLASRRARTW